MKYSKHQLDHIEDLCLEGKILSDSQLSFAAAAVSSPNLRNAIISCKAVLCARAASNARRQKARVRFEEICEDLLDRDDPLKVEVLFTLLQIPFEELAGSSSMRELAYRTVKQPGRTSLRANATCVLERLAEGGDPAAASLLEATSTDPDNKVQNNARVALQKLKTGQ